MPLPVSRWSSAEPHVHADVEGDFCNDAYSVELKPCELQTAWWPIKLTPDLGQRGCVRLISKSDRLLLVAPGQGISFTLGNEIHNSYACHRSWSWWFVCGCAIWLHQERSCSGLQCWLHRSLGCFVGINQHLGLMCGRQLPDCARQFGLNLASGIAYTFDKWLEYAMWQLLMKHHLFAVRQTLHCCMPPQKSFRSFNSVFACFSCPSLTLLKTLYLLQLWCFIFLQHMCTRFSTQRPFYWLGG